MTDEYRHPPDVLETLTEEIRDRDELGELTLAGDIGFHTFFNPARCDHEIGMQTALHMAFARTTEELWLDADIVQDNQGEVTPEAVAKEADEQLEDLIGKFHFFERFTQNLEDILTDYQNQFNTASEVDNE